MKTKDKGQRTKDKGRRTKDNVGSILTETKIITNFAPEITNNTRGLWQIE